MQLHHNDLQPICHSANISICLHPMNKLFVNNLHIRLTNLIHGGVHLIIISSAKKKKIAYFNQHRLRWAKQRQQCASSIVLISCKLLVLQWKWLQRINTSLAHYFAYQIYLFLGNFIYFHSPRSLLGNLYDFGSQIVLFVFFFLLLLYYVDFIKKD